MFTQHILSTTLIDIVPEKGFKLVGTINIKTHNTTCNKHGILYQYRVSSQYYTTKGVHLPFAVDALFPD